MAIATWPNQVLFVRHPDGVWYVGSGEFTWHSAMPTDRPCFYLPDFFLSAPQPWCVPSEFATIPDREMREILNSLADEQMEWAWGEPERLAFLQRVNQIRQLILEGALAKAVPAVFETSLQVPGPAQRMALWRAASLSHHRLIAYGGWWDSEGLLGLTPEILFFNHPGFVQSMALAGTAPADGPSLLASAKDRAEHAIVVEDIAQRLSTLGEVKQAPTREWSIGIMKHLRTDLAVAAQADFMNLVERLHPTPALGAAPRAAAWRWLKEQGEAKDRARFGAPFGVNVPGKFGLCLVAIRNIQWTSSGSVLGSGCGIVEASDGEKEWAELSLKRRAVKSLLGLDA